VTLDGCVEVTGVSGALASAGARAIVDHTSAGRLGAPDDFVTTLRVQRRVRATTRGVVAGRRR
jgi:hypothetical protein